MKAIFFGLFAILALILAIDAASIPEVQPLAQPPSIDALKDAGVENIEELSASDEYVFELNQVPASEQEGQRRQKRGCWICPRCCTFGFCRPCCRWICG